MTGDAFWRLTGPELGVILRAHRRAVEHAQRSLVMAAWAGEAFARQKRLKSFDVEWRRLTGTHAGTKQTAEEQRADLDELTAKLPARYVAA